MAGPDRMDGLEWAIAVFIGLAAAVGFLSGLRFTASGIIPALGGAVIFGLLATCLVAVIAVLWEGISGLIRRGRSRGDAAS